METTYLYTRTRRGGRGWCRLHAGAGHLVATVRRLQQHELVATVRPLASALSDRPRLADLPAGSTYGSPTPLNRSERVLRARPSCRPVPCGLHAGAGPDAQPRIEARAALRQARPRRSAYADSRSRLRWMPASTIPGASRANPCFGHELLPGFFVELHRIGQSVARGGA